VKNNTKKLFSQHNPVTIDSVPRVVEVSLDLLRREKGYFRGHFDKDWAIAPKIARLHTIRHAGEGVPVYDLELQETLLLHRFRRHTYEQRGRILGEWEALFLARHHDLPVRLLDWTSNPLVALYFACNYGKETDNNNDGSIWWFRRPYRKMYVDVFDEDKKPFDYQGIQIVFPFYPTMRMTAQSGIFTIHSPGYWTDLRKLTKAEAKDTVPRRRDAEPKRFDINEGGLWVVPKDNKKTILQDLNLLGISERTLFPELDGMVRGLMQTERFRTAEEYLKP
jgi:hypothetical protein